MIIANSEQHSALVEKIARRLAEDAGYDPDMPTQVWPPYRVTTPWGDVFRVNTDTAAPLWGRYVGAAVTALRAIEEANAEGVAKLASKMAEEMLKARDGKS